MMYSIFTRGTLTLLLFFSLQLVSAQNSFPDFYVGAFSGMLAKAQTSGKPFVLYFTAEECRACERMESGTLVDNSTVAYLNEYFLIQEVDGRSLFEGGMEIAEQFGVSTFPTLMFFSTDGRPLHKIVGYVKPEHLLATLEQEHENSLQIMEMSKRNSIFDIAHLSHIDISKPVTKVKPAQIKTEYASAYNAEEEVTDYASLSPVYELSSLKNAGYGIELGIFPTKQKLDEAIQSYQQRLVDVYVTTETIVNGKICYKLLVGMYVDGQMAMIRQQQLENDLIASGVVLNYNELKNLNASSDAGYLMQIAAEPN